MRRSRASQPPGLLCPATQLRFDGPLLRRAAPRVTRARNAVQPVRAVASEPKTATPAERQKNPEPEALVSTKSATVNKEQGEDLYKDMYLGRLFEDTCAQMYYRGKMFGFVHLYCGQEAVSTGVIRQLEARDYVCSTYRDHVHAISKGVHPKTVMAELFGKATGICRGQGGSMHMFSADHGFVSPQTPYPTCSHAGRLSDHAHYAKSPPPPPPPNLFGCNRALRVLA